VGRKGEKEAGQLWLKKAGLANSAVGRPLPEGEVADRAKLGDQSVGEGKPYPDVVKRKLARTKTDGDQGTTVTANPLAAFGSDGHPIPSKGLSGKRLKLSWAGSTKRGPAHSELASRPVADFHPPKSSCAPPATWKTAVFCGFHQRLPSEVRLSTNFCQRGDDKVVVMSNWLASTQTMTLFFNVQSSE